MSTTIDEKVVEMRFDNKDFESNVTETMSTLDKLKQSLNFDSAVNGFDTISKAAGSCNMSSLGSAVESVQAKFSALQVVAITALSNITNSAVNAGKQLISSLSVDNISAGWEKFGDKTTSVATLVAQGYDLDDVNEQLDRLNWYTDETSYNFTDMVSNIAKFTASGRDLEESVTAMEGIANWAALSGQNATTASNAMYQLSQAMSAGYMRLEDYKSVQNASMDTEEFRQKCLDAAVALGTLKENADGSYTSIVDGAESTTFTLSSFTSGLTRGCWLTSDVMMDVFNEYSGAVDDIYEYAEEKGITASEAIEELGDSVDEFGLKAFKAAQEARTWADVVDSVKDAVSTGWMNTFELIFGDYEEATALWTDLANAMYDVFAGGAEDRNAVLEEWKELGGRDDLIDAFWNTWDGVGEIVSTVKEAFRDIFPATTAEELHSFTAALLELTEKFKMSDETSENLKNTLKGLFAILDIVKQGFSAVLQLVQPLFNHLNILSGGILSVTGSWGEWLTSLDESLKENEIFSKAESNTALEFWLGGGTMSLSSFAEELEAFAPGLVSYANQVRGLNAGAVACSALAANILFEMAKNLPENTTALEFWFGGGTMTLSAFAEELDAFAPSLVSYADQVSGINARAVVCSALAANMLFDMAKNLPENTTALEFWFGGGSMSLSSFAEELDAFAPSLVSYADQVSGLNAAAVVCSALAANILFEMAKNLPENNTALEFWFGGGSMSLSSFADELEAFAPGLVVYADTVSGLNAAAVSRSAYAANILFEMAKNLPENNTALEFWFGGGSVSLSDFADELKEFGPGLMEYANSVEGLKSGTVARSVYAANILLEMANNLPENNTALEFWFGGGTISLSDFANELTEFGPGLMEYANSVDGLKSGTVARSAYAAKTLFEMANNLPENNTALEFWFGGGTVSLSSFADELKEFGPSLMEYANSVDGLKSGVVARSVYAANILFDMANNLPENNTALEFWLGGGAVSLSSFADELDAFGPSLMSYATSVDGLKSGVVARSAYAAKTLFEMANNLPENNTALEFWFGGGTVSLSSFADELKEFGPSLMEYANSVDGLKSGVVANSVYAAKVLFNMAENLPDNEGVLEYWLGGGTMSLSGFAAELEAFGPSLAAYASSVDGLDSSVVSNSVYAAKVLFNMAENLPDNGDIYAWFTGSVTLSKLGEELAAFAPYLKSYSDDVSGIDSDIVSQSASAGSAIAEMAALVPDTIPDLSSLGEHLEAFGASLKAYYQSISGVDTVKISAVTVQANRLVSLMDDMNDLGNTDGVSAFVTGLNTLGEASVDGYVSAFTGSDSKVTDAVLGLADSMITNLSLQTERVREVFENMLDAGEAALRGGYTSMNAIGKVLVDTLISGVNTKKSTAKQAFTTIVDMAKSAVRGYYNDFRSAGIYLVTGFANGISSATYLATAKASAMASAANTAARKALDEHSPSKKGYQTGSFFGQGFVNGIVAWIGASGETGAEMANMALTSLRSTLSSLSSVIDQNMDSEPTIRPVLDLSNIKSGASQINSMLSGAPALAYSTSMAGQISTSMREREIQNGSEGRELLQAIKGLGKNLADRGGNTYNTVNGITYDDGSNVTDAVRSLIRAAKIERRT